MASAIFIKCPPTPSAANLRWINSWEKDDPIAWPVEPLMSGAGDVVVDRYVDVSNDPIDAYWASASVHDLIAAAW
jgi:hypothetical protein